MMNMPVVQKSMGCILCVAGARESKQVVFEGCLIRVKWTLLTEDGSGLSQMCLARACICGVADRGSNNGHSRTRPPACTSLLAFSSILSAAYHPTWRRQRVTSACTISRR
jgi:hypothetical protein